MRFSVDSNVLVYALLKEDKRKHEIASDIMIRAMLLDCTIAAQSLAEFLNVVRRKRASAFGDACAQARRWTDTITTVGTRSEDVLEAGSFCVRYRLQFWDSLIWQVARSARASILLSEDMQDGFEADGMRVLNPFAEANGSALRDLLAAAEPS